MANIIKIKRKESSGVPTLASLSVGEGCLVVPDKKLCYKVDASTMVVFQDVVTSMNTAALKITGIDEEDPEIVKDAVDENGDPILDGTGTQIKEIDFGAWFAKQLIAHGVMTKLPTPIFSEPAVSADEFFVSVLNLPEGATVVWTLNGVVDPAEEGENLSKEGLEAATTYSVKAKYHLDGFIDSNEATIEITTEEEAPVDDDLLEGFTRRNTLPQVANGIAPFDATDNVFDFAGRSTGQWRYYNPNLALPPTGTSEILYRYTGIEGNSCLRPTNDGGHNDRELGYAENGGLDGATPDGIWYYNPGGSPEYPVGQGLIGDGDLMGWERTDGVVKAIKYIDGVKSVIKDYGEISGGLALYITFGTNVDTKLMHLQHKGAVIVDNAGNPI